MSKLALLARFRRRALALPEHEGPAVADDVLRVLRLESARVADGALAGFHASARLGQGLEFAGFRAYAPGDDLRLLDRRRSLSDTGLIVRQHEIERDRALLVLVDGTTSMEDARGATSKRRWADVLASALVRIVTAQGDAACVARFGKDTVVGGFLRGKRAFERATEVLGSGPASRAAEGPSLEAAIQRVVKCAGWIVLLSDFLDASPPFVGVLGEARARGAAVVAVRLEAQNEREFPYPAAVHLQDTETGERVRTFGPAARTRYLEARAGHRSATEDRLRSHGVALVDVWTDGKPEAALVGILSEASARRRSPLA